MRSVKITAIMVMLSGAVIYAQSAVAPVTKAAREGAKSMIHGKVVDANASPLPNVAVRLRNIQLNHVEQKSVSDRSGEFTFVTQPEIPYVVEVVDRAGRVLAVGDVVVVHTGEIAGIVVALPSHVPALAGALWDTAGSVISAAAGIGITTLQLAVARQPEPPPASPEQ